LIRPFNPAVVNQVSFYQICTIFTAVGYSLYRIFNDKDRLVYSAIQGRKWFRIKSLVRQSGSNGFFIAGYCTLSFACLYFVFASTLFHPLLNVLRMLGFKVALQSFSLWTPFSLTLQLATFLRFFRVVVCWEFLHSVYNLYMTMVFYSN
jgi:hypothetical protein